MLPEPSHWKEMNINSMWPRYKKPTPPVCTCSSRSPWVTDERQKDTFLNFPVASERNIELLPPELHQKPEKFAEPNQFTKRFLFDCRARVKSLKSRGWHPWKKKKERGMHWTHAFVFFWSLFVEGLYMEEEVVGSANQPQVISYTHMCAHTFAQPLQENV